MSFELVPMTPDHIPFVAQLEKENFSVPESEKSLRETLESDYAIYYTAFCDGKAVGYITAYASYDTADILSVAIDVNKRRMGLGRKTLEAFINECRTKGFILVTLEVRQSNAAARRLYESLGFVQTGLRKGYYTVPKEDALLYDLKL